MSSSRFWTIDPVEGLHWRETDPLGIRSINLEVSVETRDCSASALDELSPSVHRVAVASERPKMVSIRVAAGPFPKTRGFCFEPRVAEDARPADAALSKNRGCVETAASSADVALSLGRPTRIRPPKDVIKLQDRLNYVLQPPLEALLADRSFRFPFKPFSYQCEGIAFLYPRQTAILADEMGLGKTMQAITTIRLLIHRRELRSVLLVCPKPLVTNWLREFELWAPELSTVAIEGNSARRHWQWLLADVPVKIVNYELLHRDRTFLSANESQAAFDLVVLDESQRIKNRRSATSQAVRSLRGRRRWALTGTPVENSAEDLVGIFEFLAPGFLSSEMRPRRMGRAVGDYILRRTKEKVLTDLPPRLFRDAELDLSAEQRAAYELAEGEGVVNLNELGNRITIQHVFELVLRLKQICNFDPATGASSKLERLEADLEEVADSGRKALVFSQWVGTIDRLREPLRRFGPLEYHGRVPASRRDAVITRFRDDPDAHVLLISYGAGSVGLNLQFAGYVFLFDRWWNPAVEDQAINRVHRIGSAGPVTVTRFLTVGTIEERIQRILDEKRELFDTIFSDAEPRRRQSLTQEEIFGLFDLSSVGAVERHGRHEAA